MNNVDIIGRLTKAVEAKFFEDGKVVVKFSIALNRGKGKDDVDYFDCEAWGKSAETLLNYTDKGSQVGLSGRLKQDRWTAQDGTNRSAVRIIVNQVTLLGSKQSADGQSSAEDDADPGFNVAPAAGKVPVTSVAGKAAKRSVEPDYDEF